jgi:hypothetical protein
MLNAINELKMQQKLESNYVTAQPRKASAVLKQNELNPISADNTNSLNQVKVELAGPSSHKSPRPIITEA